jgi:hypothetical protein
MALMVAEVMNPELFSVHEYDRVDDALATLLALGLSAAPVVDAMERPIGMVSWRDLVRPTGGDTIAGRMTRPATTVRKGDSIEAAARLMAEAGLHHAPVVDPAGRLVGFVSMLDAMRGVLGLPAGHPVGFPHYDADTGAVWSDPRPLSEGELDEAPAGPGVLVLIEGGRNQPDRVVWAEATAKVRSRLPLVARAHRRLTRRST